MNIRARRWSREAVLCGRANRRIAGGPWQPLFATVSRLGDGPIWVALGLAIAMLDPSAGLVVALKIGLAALLGGTAYRCIKRRTLRPRPFVRHRRIHALVPPLDEFSFPSGHTLHAVSITTIAVAHYPWLATVLVPFTALVAISRVVLGLHYPTDVLAAGLFGLLLGGAAVSVLPPT